MCAFTHRRHVGLFNHNKPMSFGEEKGPGITCDCTTNKHTTVSLFEFPCIMYFFFVRHVFSDFKDRIASKLISFFVVRQEIEGGGQRIKEEEEQAQYLSITKSTQHGIKTAVRAKPFFIPGREKK